MRHCATTVLCLLHGYSRSRISVALWPHVLTCSGLDEALTRDRSQRSALIWSVMYKSFFWKFVVIVTIINQSIVVEQNTYRIYYYNLTYVWHFPTIIRKIYIFPFSFARALRGTEIISCMTWILQVLFHAVHSLFIWPPYSSDSSYLIIESVLFTFPPVSEWQACCWVSEEKW